MYATTLEKKISKYLKKFGVKRAYSKGHFCYHYGDKTINFSILSYPTDEELMDFIEKTYDVNIRSWFFIFALLHEVGHHMTLDQIDPDTLGFETAVRNQIFENYNLEDYFSLPSERLANEWAVEYITNHEEECWEFQRKCLAVMKHIYKKRSFPH